MALSDPHLFALASSVTAKSAYLYLLSVNFLPPHCEEKFLPGKVLSIGQLPGGSLASALSIDLSLTWLGRWRMVFYTLLIG